MTSGESVRASNEVAIRVEHVGEATVLSVAGDMDMTTTPEVQAAVIKVLDERPGTVVLDIDEVSFLGSDGIAVLVRCHQYAGSQVRFRVVALNPVSLRPMQLTGLIDVIPIYPTREEALGAD